MSKYLDCLAVAMAITAMICMSMLLLSTIPTGQAAVLTNRYSEMYAEAVLIPVMSIFSIWRLTKMLKRTHIKEVRNELYE